MLFKIIKCRKIASYKDAIFLNMDLSMINFLEQLIAIVISCILEPPITIGILNFLFVSL